MYVKDCGPGEFQCQAAPPVGNREASMNRFHPHRPFMNYTRNAKFLAVFWLYLIILYLLSFWA
jgi:hypothetical protein